MGVSLYVPLYGRQVHPVVRCLCFLSFDETNHVYDFCLRVLSFGFGSVEIKSVDDLGINLSIVLVIEFLNHLQIFLAERMAVEAL